MGRVFYGASTVICTPASLAQEVGLALGAQAGQARLTEVLKEGGFTRVRRAAEDALQPHPRGGGRKAGKELRQFEDPTRFVGPCRLLVGAMRAGDCTRRCNFDCGSLDCAGRDERDGADRRDEGTVTGR